MKRYNTHGLSSRQEKVTMFAIQASMSTSEAQLSTQDTLLEHMQAVVNAMSNERCYHIIALNGNDDKHTTYAYNEGVWYVLKVRNIQESDWLQFYTGAVEHNPLFIVDVHYGSDPHSDTHEVLSYGALPRLWREGFTGILDNSSFVRLEWEIGDTRVVITSQEIKTSEPCYICSTDVEYVELGNGEECAVPECTYCQRVVCAKHREVVENMGWLCPECIVLDSENIAPF